MRTGRVTTLITMLAAVFALAVSASAFAADPAQDVYNPTGEVLNVVNGGGPADIVPGPGTSAGGGGNAKPVPATRRESGGNTPVAAAPTGSLPFTGFEAGLVALAGLALVGTGFAMRRVARNNS
jgi:hypothetical protein